MIKQVGERLEEISSAPLLKPLIDWNAESQRIEKIAQKTHGDPRGITLAEQASQEGLQTIQNGNSTQSYCHKMIQNYIQKICEVKFIDRIPLLQEHYNDVDQVTIDARVEDMKPHLQNLASNMAEQIVQKGSVKSLRLPKRSRPNSLLNLSDNVEDLLQ